MRSILTFDEAERALDSNSLQMNVPARGWVTLKRYRETLSSNEGRALPVRYEGIGLGVVISEYELSNLQPLFGDVFWLRICPQGPQLEPDGLNQDGGTVL